MVKSMSHEMAQDMRFTHGEVNVPRDGTRHETHPWRGRCPHTGPVCRPVGMCVCGRRPHSHTAAAAVGCSLPCVSPGRCLPDSQTLPAATSSSAHNIIHSHQRFYNV